MSRMHHLFLQQYCTPLSIGLALDVCMFSYKKVILGKIHHSLSCLAY